MVVQDTVTVAGVERAPPTAAAAERSARPARRLPVQKDWPTWALVITQIGILVGAIALWEIAARAGWIDAFFWSQPSAIFRTMTIFFTTGDAFTDIAFTFRSTVSRHGFPTPRKTIPQKPCQQPSPFACVHGL